FSNGATSAPTLVSVRVNRPVAGDDWIDTDGTSPVTVRVLENDTDPDGNEHIDPTLGSGALVTRLSNPQHGTAVLNPDGSFTYTAAPGFTGTDSFRYTVTDDAGAASLPATVFIRVNLPSAAADFAETNGTTAVTIDVVANDQDPDGNEHLVPGSVTIVTPPQHGQIRNINPVTGAVTYPPDPGWAGSAPFPSPTTNHPAPPPPPAPLPP